MQESELKILLGNCELAGFQATQSPSSFDNDFTPCPKHSDQVSACQGTLEQRRGGALQAAGGGGGFYKATRGGKLELCSLCASADVSLFWGRLSHAAFNESKGEGGSKAYLKDPLAMRWCLE